MKNYLCTVRAVFTRMGCTRLGKTCRGTRGYWHIRAQYGASPVVIEGQGKDSYVWLHLANQYGEGEVAGWLMRCTADRCGAPLWVPLPGFEGWWYNLRGLR